MSLDLSYEGAKEAQTINENMLLQGWAWRAFGAGALSQAAFIKALGAFQCPKALA